MSNIETQAMNQALNMTYAAMAKNPDHPHGDNEDTVSGPAEMDDDTLAWKVEGREEEILAVLCFALDNTTLLETIREQHPKAWRVACLEVVAEKEL